MSLKSERCPTFVAAALVYFGAVFGTLSRWVLTLAVPSLWGIHLVNVLGTALLGFLTAVLSERRAKLKLFLGTGFCGAFTTYSALAVGIVQTSPKAGLLHSVLALTSGVVAAFAGMWLGSILSNRTIR